MANRAQRANMAVLILVLNTEICFAAERNFDQPMFGNLKDWTVLLEKLPGLGRSGLVLICIGGAVWIAQSAGFLPDVFLGVELKVGAKLFVVIGSGLFVGGILLAIPSLFLAGSRSAGALRQRLKKRREIIGNLRMLGDYENLILLHLLQTPDGRMSTLHNFPPFVRLLELRVIHHEDEEYYEDSWRGLTIPVGVVRLSSCVFRKRKKYLRELEPWMSEVFKIDTSDERAALQKIELILRNWVSTGRIR